MTTYKHPDVVLFKGRRAVFCFYAGTNAAFIKFLDTNTHACVRLTKIKPG